MKDADLLVTTFELEEARPSRPRRPAYRHLVAIDLVAIDLAIFDPLEDTKTSSRRDYWLRRSLPRAFEDARILSYRRTRHTGLSTDLEIDIEALVLRLLNLYSGLRQQTDTVRFTHCAHWLRWCCNFMAGLCLDSITKEV